MEDTPCKYSQFKPAQGAPSGQKTLHPEYQIKIRGLVCYGNCAKGAEPCDENCQPEADEYWGNLRCVSCGFETPLAHYNPTTREYKHAAFRGQKTICNGPMKFRKWPETSQPDHADQAFEDMLPDITTETTDTIRNGSA